MAAKPTQSQIARRLLKEYGSVAVAAAVVALGFRFFVIEAYRIPTSAMRPALEPGDVIFVEKLGHRSRMPARGDVVVYASPLSPDRDLVRRARGLPGDRVVSHGKEEIVSTSHVFLLTDPHDGSQPSGEIVPVSTIKGKAAWIWLSVAPPPSDASWFRLPRFRWNRMFTTVQ